MEAAVTRRTYLALLVVGLIGVVAIVGVAAAQRGAEAGQKQAKETGQKQAQIDLVLEFPKRSVSLGDLTERLVSNIGSSGDDGVSFVVDSFFDVYYVTNIGSSGQDGVRFSFDSFFDITYEPTFRRIETEMVALSLSGSYSVSLNEAQLIDKAREAAASAGGDLYYGHITVLK